MDYVISLVIKPLKTLFRNSTLTQEEGEFCRTAEEKMRKFMMSLPATTEAKTAFFRIVHRELKQMTPPIPLEEQTTIYNNLQSDFLKLQRPAPPPLSYIILNSGVKHY